MARSEFIRCANNSKLLTIAVFSYFSAIKVAHTGQTVEQAVENVIAAVSCIAKIVPRGWGNIQALNLKTTDSISLPIYNSLPEKALSSELPEPPKKKKKNMDTEKISEMEEES